MTSPPEQPVERAGLFPWLPWPLRGMRWWTEPIRAERLAALRIGLALLVLVDILTSYWPNRRVFFGPESLGTLDNFNWYAENGRGFWSILRGPAGDLNFTLLLAAGLGLSVWLLLDLRARWTSAPADAQPPSAWPVAGWSAACGLAVWGYWIRVLRDGEAGLDSPARLWMWLGPLTLGIFAGMFWAAETLLASRRRPPEPARRSHLTAWYVSAWGFFPLLAVAGFLLHWQHPWNEETTPAWLHSLLEPWLLNHDWIAAWMGVWAVATVLLLLGWRTRLAAVACWVLSTSFANVNPNIDNAGDTIRAILLFYLMLCPCGAVWSVDARFAPERQKRRAAVVVSPWPVRLIFVQLVLIYFLNGAYKILSEDWRSGDQLYYVLHDTTLTRFSFVQLPLNYALTRLMTWTVLAWELAFPLLVLWKWSRIVALAFGVLFHLGIALTMDLGLFSAYALCMYLPLAPWERWADRTPVV